MKMARIVGLCILLAGLSALFLPGGPALAQEGLTPKMELEPTYRTLEATAPGASFEFEVALRYTGNETRDFDLAATVPQGWDAFVTPMFGSQRIRSIRLEPNKFSPDKVKVHVSAPLSSMPEPGDYEVVLEASSGEIKGNVKLKAVITATYSFNLRPTNERLNTTATAGKDNFFSFVIQNTGSGAIDDVKFSSRKPDGWTIKFTPEKIDELSSGSFQTVDVNIKPAPKTIAGDYQITFAANATQTTKTIDIRVTVETPTVWGWIGIGIILVVVAGVAAIFMRFSRR